MPLDELMKKTAPEIVAECIRLRCQERLPLSAIGERTGVSQGTLSVMLRPYPLNDDELAAFKEKSLAKARAMRVTTIKAQERRTRDPSQIYKVAASCNLSTTQKGRIGEIVVILRLACRGISAMIHPNPAGSVDVIIVENSTVVRLQVKTLMEKDEKGISLERRKSSKNRFRYDTGDFDFIVGYYMKEDCCYVISEEETFGRNGVIFPPANSKEAWKKITSFMETKSKNGLTPCT